MLVATLVGVLWPERPDQVEATGMEYQPQLSAVQRPIPPGGRDPAAGPAVACAAAPCDPALLTLPGWR
jgi:hypothetical protein